MSEVRVVLTQDWTGFSDEIVFTLAVPPYLNPSFPAYGSRILYLVPDPDNNALQHVVFSFTGITPKAGGVYKFTGVKGPLI